MLIPMTFILNALKTFQPDARLLPGDAQFSRVSLLSDEDREPDTLYVGPGSSIVEADDRENSCGFVSIGEPAAARSNMIVLPDLYNVHDVFGHLQMAFYSFAEYELKLMKAAITGSYQDVIDIGHQFMMNPLVLLDSGYRVLALAPDAEVPGDREWDYIRSMGTTSPELVKTLKEEGILSVETRGLPQIYCLPGFPRASIWFNIYLNSRYAARVVVIDAFRPFSLADQLATKILCEAFELKMSRDEAFQFIRGKGPVYNMVHDLVTGVHLDRDVVADRLHYVSSWAKGVFRVLFVPLGSIDEQSFDYYARVLERKVDSRSVLVDNALVTVIHYRRKEDIPLVTDAITAFLSKNALRGGLSNEFDDLSELHGFYRQAVACLSLDQKEKTLRLYEEVALDHILSFCSSEKPNLLCHPTLLRLKRFDEEKGTNLAETLHTYIKNERSIAQTAERLHIHRNTLLYRINKIAALLDIDLNDPNVRLHLLVSYRLLKPNI